MKTKSRTPNNKHKGIALIWGMLMFIFVIGLIGIMIDFGRGYLAVHELQNAADSAALIGARYVPIIYDPNTGTTDPYIAKSIAAEYASKHFAAAQQVFMSTDTSVNPADYIDADGEGIPIDPYDDTLEDDLYIGHYVEESGLFYVDHTSPDSMLAIARRDGSQFRNDPTHPSLALLFGPLFGVDVANVKRIAIAKVLDVYGAGMLALGECDCPGITFEGGGAYDDLIVTGLGSLYVNSSSANSLANEGKISIDVEKIYTHGGIGDKFYKHIDLTSTDVKEGSPVELDPYGWPDGEQPLPDHDPAYYTSLPDRGTITDANDGQILSPGYYSGGFQIASTTSITLAPGDYYLDSSVNNASMTLAGTSSITGIGVTLHLVGDGDFGIDMGGSANIDISAPTSGTYEGVAIYQQRNPDYNCADSCKHPWSKAFPISELLGTGDIIIDGAVYMPHNRLELGGTGFIYLGRIVADRYLIHGSGHKEVHYKGEPKIAPKSYLVR